MRPFGCQANADQITQENSNVIIKETAKTIDKIKRLIKHNKTQSLGAASSSSNRLRDKIQPPTMSQSPII